MLKKSFMGLMILGLSVGVMLTPSFAQQDQAEEIWEFTFGTIVRIGKDEITIMEYNFEQEQEMEGDYAVSEATEYLNIDGLSSLRVGDEVEVEFKLIDGKNVVMAIAKDEGESMEDFPEDLQYEDMMEGAEGEVSS